MTTPATSKAPSTVGFEKDIQEPTMSTRQSTDTPPALDPEKADDAPDAPLGEPAQQRMVQGFRWWIILAAIYITCFIYGLDNTIVADIQAAAVETFGSVQKLGWLGSGFPLGSVATILTLGKLFGTFDVKWLYVASIAMFTAGSALCGGAPNMDALIVGRVWAGAGGAGMYLGCLNLLSVYTTIQERSIYISFVGVTWGIGCILGPVVGGAFADSSLTWRWAFYINLIIAGLFAPVFIWGFIPYNPQPNRGFWEKLRTVDWVGAVLNAGVWTSFVLVFTFGGAIWAWNDGRTIAMFVVFGVLTVMFALQQTFAFLTTIEQRIFPIDFLKVATLVNLYVLTNATSTALFVSIYYIPLFFQFTRGDTGVEAAVRLLPFILLNIFSVLLNGYIMPRLGWYMPFYVVSGVLVTIGGSLMYALVDSSTSNSSIYGFSVLLAIGSGLVQQAAYSVAPAKVEPHRVPDAIGFINVAQIGGTVIALTITSTVFQNIGYQHVSAALTGLDFSKADIQAALAGAKSTVFQNTTPEVRQAVLDGVVKAIGDGYILVITAGAVILIGSLLLKRERMILEVAAGG